LHEKLIWLILGITFLSPEIDCSVKNLNKDEMSLLDIFDGKYLNNKEMQKRIALLGPDKAL